MHKRHGQSSFSRFLSTHWTPSLERSALFLVAVLIATAAVAAPPSQTAPTVPATTKSAQPAPLEKPIPQIVIVGKRMTPEQKQQFDARAASTGGYGKK